MAYTQESKGQNLLERPGFVLANYGWPRGVTSSVPVSETGHLAVRQHLEQNQARQPTQMQSEYLGILRAEPEP